MSINSTGPASVATATGVQCAFDDSTCKFAAFGERLTDVEYISAPFLQWGNIIIIIWTLALALSTKFVFSIPFKLYDQSTKAERDEQKRSKKEARTKARSARRKFKKAQKAVLSLGRLKALSSSNMKANSDAAVVAEKDEASGETKNTDSNETATAITDNSGAGDVELVEGDAKKEKITTPALVQNIPQFRSFDHQIVQSDNKAMSILYAGFVVSVMYAASGSRIPTDYTDDALESLTSFLVFSMIGYVLICVTVMLTSKLLLFKINVRHEILQGNLSVAVTVAGICLATSINLRASLMGNGSTDIGETVGVTVMFFALGQISVVLFGFLFQIVTFYDDQEEALKGNVAAGIKWAGNLVSLAIVSSSPIEKTSELASFGVFFSLGGVFVILFDQLVSRLVIPGKLNEEISKDQNWGYALIATSILLTTSLAVDALLVDLPCPGSDAWDKYQASFITPDPGANEG